MIKTNVVMAGLSSLLKFLSNAVLMLALARVLGPESFGSFAFAMAAAVFLGIIVDYGYNLQVIKEIAQSPELVETEVPKIIVAKSFLSLIAMAGCLIFLLTVNLETAILVILLTLAMILFSYGQFFFAVLRGLNRFVEETNSTFKSNAVLLLLIAPAVVFRAGTYLLALAFLVSRAVFFALGLNIYLGEFKLSVSRGIISLRKILNALAFGLPYAMLVISGLLFLTIDTFIVKYMLGSEAVGIYQGGIRFVSGTLMLSETLVVSYLPVLSYWAIEDRRLFAERANQFIRVSLVFILPISAAMIIMPDTIVSVILGNAYTETIALLPWFGMILILRSLTASYGALLTAKGLQNQRTAAIALSLMTFVIGAFALIFRYGLLGVAFASLISHVIMLGLFFWDIQKRESQVFVEPRTLGIGVVAGAIIGVAHWLRPAGWLAVILVGSITLTSIVAGLTRAELKSLIKPTWLIKKREIVA